LPPPCKPENGNHLLINTVYIITFVEYHVETLGGANLSILTRSIENETVLAFPELIRPIHYGNGGRSFLRSLPILLFSLPHRVQKKMGLPISGKARFEVLRSDTG
jgi:hypothetical protein